MYNIFKIWKAKMDRTKDFKSKYMVIVKGLDT